MSKLSNSMCRIFPKEKKPNHQMRNKELPGPGHYQLTRLSDFGYYKGTGRHPLNNSFDMGAYAATKKANSRKGNRGVGSRGKKGGKRRGRKRN